MGPHDPYAALAALAAELADEPRDSMRDLDRAAALIGVHGDPRPSADADGGAGETVARLDELAERFDGSDATELTAWLAAEGFRGNAGDYYDPRNSYLGEVLDRRLGIPITLSVVAIEVGRRRGIALVGIGLPGEFVVAERDDPDRFHNPFRGRSMDLAEVDALVRRFTGPAGRLTPAMRRPLGTLDISTRMLANLVAIFERTAAHADLAWALRLRATLPESAAAEAALLRLHARFN